MNPNMGINPGNMNNPSHNPMAAQGGIGGMHSQPQNNMNTHGMGGIINPMNGQNTMIQNQMNAGQMRHDQMKFMQQQQAESRLSYSAQKVDMLRTQQMLGPPPDYKSTQQNNPQTMMQQTMMHGGRFPSAPMRQHAQRNTGNGENNLQHST